MKKTFEELKQFAETLVKTCPLMEGREKGNLGDITGVQVHITDYDFLEGDDGNYAVFIIEENSELFFFGSSVLTEYLVNLDENGYKETIQAEGLPVTLTKKKSKNKREYYAVELF